MVKINLKQLILIVLPIILAVSGFVFGWLARDVKLGLTWMLLLGFGGLFGELIALGVWDGLHTQNWKNRKLWAGILLIIIVMSGIGYLIYIGVLGSIFPPGLAPAPFQKGYYRVYIVDMQSGVNINLDNITRVDGYNLTIYEDDLATGITYYCNRGSYLFINASVYYPIAVALWASGGTDPLKYENNTIYLMKRANPDDVSFQVVRWYNETGRYWNYTDKLPAYDGVYKIHLSIYISLPSQNTSFYGASAWIPKTVLPTYTLAYQNNWTWTTNWLGFECENMTNYHFSFLSGGRWDLQGIYMIPNQVNCTIIPTVWYGLECYVSANFTHLESIRLFDGLIDNYNYPIATVTI